MTKNIVVIQKSDGSFYAMESDCKHQNANLLVKGLPKDFVVTCPRHSWPRERWRNLASSRLAWRRRGAGSR